MNQLNQPRRRSLARAALLLVGLLLLSGCSAVILPEGWAGLTVDGTLTDGRYQNARYLYVAYRNTIQRIDLTTDSAGRGLSENQRATDRQIDWAASGPNSAQFFAAPALGPEGRLFIGSYNHSVYAFDTNANPRTQNLTTWNAPASTDKIIGSGVVYNNKFYVGQDKGVQAYDTATGQVGPSFLEGQFVVWAHPVIDADSNTLYLAGMDHKLYALDADTLKPVWREPVNVGGAMPAAPLLQGTKLYVGTLANELVEIDTVAQRITNRFTTEGWVWSTPVPRDGVLFFGDMKGFVYALNTASWTTEWKVQDTERPGAIRGQVAVVDGKVIAASESKYLRAYDQKTGAPIWTSSPASPERILSDVVVVGNDVIVTTLSESDLVIAYDLQSGGRNWSVRKPNQDDLNRITQTPPAAR